MKSYLVIDGYNLLHELAKAEGISLNNEMFEVKREHLIEMIANHAALSGEETVLVFDAGNREGELTEEKLFGITVIYTGKDVTADTYIERYLYTRPKYSHVSLVTSDAKIQDMALLTGAERFSSRQFLKEIDALKDAHNEYATKDRKKNINVLGDHLQEDQLELFELLRLGLLEDE